MSRAGRAVDLLRADVAGLVVLALLGLTVTLEIDSVIDDFAPPTMTAALLLLAGLASLGAQAVHSLRALRRLRARAWPTTLCVQAIAFGVPAIAYGFDDWGGLLGYLLGSAALVLPAGVALGIFAATELAVMVLEPTVGGLTAYDTVYAVLASALVPLLVWSLSRLADAVAELDASRRYTAELAVARERHRRTEDMDALLGRRLFAIRQAATSVAQSIDAKSDPDATIDAINDIVDQSRGAMHDIRSVAAGDRDTSMSAQLDFARCILGAAGVEFDAEVPTTTVSAASDALLAEIIREGVTSTLRRAATHCRLNVAVDGAVARLVMDDGLPADAMQFAALDARLRAVGGQVQRPADSSGVAMLVATMPADLA